MAQSQDGRSIEDYALRRFALLQASVPPSSAQSYFHPLDALKIQFEREGRTLVSFANYDYLGLGSDLRVKKSACQAIMDSGIGAGASRLVGGERKVHRFLEQSIAAFLGVPDALALVSGYMTNFSLIGHLLTSKDLIVCDELSHNSIHLGAKLSRATVKSFAHNDLDHLDAILKEHNADFVRVMIVVEGLYSMEGDIPDLPRLMEIKNRYRAWLLVDEAHSIGVLGSTGRGATEHFGIDPNGVEFIVGTMSKSFATCGGFVAGSQAAVDWLRWTLPAFVYSVGLPPLVAAAVTECISIIEAEPERVAAVQENSKLFLEVANQHGLDTGTAVGLGIVPVIFQTQKECMAAATALLNAGYYAPAIMRQAVPKDKPRIRFFLSAAHERLHIVGVVGALAAAVGSASHHSTGIRQPEYDVQA